MFENEEEKGASLNTQEADPLSKLYLKREDMTNVSRSKLEHLKDMALDDRANSSSWNTDRAFGTICSGIFFTALGALFNISNLSLYGKIGCIVGVFMGVFQFYFFRKEYESEKQRKDFGKKIATKIDELLRQMQ